MLAWIKAFHESNRQTKFFIYNLAFYMIILVGTTVYCYAQVASRVYAQAHSSSENVQSK